MANHVGQITVELMVRVGEGEPQSLGFVHVPITVASVSTSRLIVDLSQHIEFVREDLLRVFGRDADGTETGNLR